MNEEQPYLRIPLDPPEEWLEKLEKENSDEEEQESENEHVVILQL